MRTKEMLTTWSFSACWYFFLREIFGNDNYPESIIDEIRFIPAEILADDSALSEFLPLMTEELLEGPYLSDDDSEFEQIYKDVAEQIRNSFGFTREEAKSLANWLQELAKEEKKEVHIFWDMDGTLARWRPEASLLDLYEKGYFASLDPESSLCQLAEDLAAKDKVESFILTSVLDDSIYARNEKIQWVSDHTPRLQDNILCVPCGVKKSSFVEDLFRRELSKTDILIDDHSPNLIAWEKAGGTALKWINKVNNTGRSSFSGTRIGTVEEIRKIIEKIQESK